MVKTNEQLIRGLSNSLSLHLPFSLSESLVLLLDLLLLLPWVSPAHLKQISLVLSKPSRPITALRTVGIRHWSRGNGEREGSVFIRLQKEVRTLERRMETSGSPPASQHPLPLHDLIMMSWSDRINVTLGQNVQELVPKYMFNIRICVYLYTCSVS